MKHLLNKVSMGDWLTFIALMVGFCVQWGAITARVEATEASVADTASVKQDIAVLKALMTVNNEQIKEVRHDIKQLLRRNP